MYAVFEIMVERLRGMLEELDGVWSEELVEVNAVLRGLGWRRSWWVRWGWGWCREGGGS